jgi:hypothetical protein
MRPLSLFLFPLVVSLPLAGIAQGCSLTETGLQPDDAAAGDVTSPDTGPLPTNWCATTGAGHDFCADFDASLRGTEPGAWCNAVPNLANCGATEMGGTVVRDLAASTSAPASASAQTMLGGPVSKAFLTRDFPGDSHSLALAFDLQLDAVGTASAATLAGITLEIVSGVAHGVTLVATPPGDAGPNAGLTIVETRVGGGLSSTALSLTLPLKKFVRVELIVGIAPNTVTVTVDGASSSTLTIDAPGSALGRSVQLGLDLKTVDAWQAHVDDVTFDFTK